MALNAHRLAEALSNNMVALMSPAPTGATLAQVQQGCLAIAQAIVDEIKQHADVVIPTTAQIQRIPDPVVALDPTLGPVSPVTISGAID